MNSDFIMQYLGKPWSNPAEAHTAEGYDCYSLVKDVYKKQLGLELPPITFDACDIKKSAEFFGTETFKTDFKSVDFPTNYDIVLTRGRGYRHVGLWYNNRILHSVKGLGCMYSYPSDLKTMGFNDITYKRYKHEINHS